MKKKISKSLGNLKNKVVPASKVPVPEKKINKELNELKEVLIISEDCDNGERLRHLAKAKKVSIEDLFIWIEGNYGKKPNRATTEEKGVNQGTVQDFTKENAVGKPYNPKSNWLYNAKMAKQRKA